MLIIFSHTWFDMPINWIAIFPFVYRHFESIYVHEIGIYYFAHSWNFFVTFTCFLHTIRWYLRLCSFHRVRNRAHEWWTYFDCSTKSSPSIMHNLQWRNALENSKYWQNPSKYSQFIGCFFLACLVISRSFSSYYWH